jgi:hypothetical protein
MSTRATLFEASLSPDSSFSTSKEISLARRLSLTLTRARRVGGLRTREGLAEPATRYTSVKRSAIVQRAKSTNRDMGGPKVGRLLLDASNYSNTQIIRNAATCEVTASAHPATVGHSYDDLSRTSGLLVTESKGARLNIPSPPPAELRGGCHRCRRSRRVQLGV